MSVLEYKCPCCGGGINFDSSTQKMVCPFCDSSFDTESLKQYDAELNNKIENKYDWEAYNDSTGSGSWSSEEMETLNGYMCPSCGGEIIGDKNTAATSCPYCNNPAINMKKLSGVFKPDYIIPFKLDKNNAKGSLKKYLRGKKLLPKMFTDEHRIDSITGIYVPFWLFDCNTKANIRYKATKVKNWSDQNYNYTKTDTYNIIRNGHLQFEKVPVDGSEKISDDYMEAIEPFDYNATVEFQTAYLSGYLADKYDNDAEKSKPRANERIKKSTEKIFAETVQGYSSVTPQDTNIQFSNGSVRYALLPVWMLNTKYKDKIYGFAMNGQTGKFIGELPISWGRFWAWFFGLFISISIIGCAVAAML